MSAFSESLSQLLAARFSRKDWAAMLHVTEPAISQWVNDRTLPRSDILMMIFRLAENSASVSRELIKQFRDMADQPAVDVSPLGERMGESVWKYMSGNMLEDLPKLLKQLSPKEQQAIYQGHVGVPEAPVVTDFSTLLEEVRRVARDEAKAQTSGAVRALMLNRVKLAQLKQRQRIQEKLIARLSGNARNSFEKAFGCQSPDSRARMMRLLRRKSGLPVEDYAKLLDVTPETVEAWERGIAIPRRGQLVAMNAIRSLGVSGPLSKRQAARDG